MIPRSLFSLAASTRIAIALVALAALWLLTAWAVALP